MFHKAISLDTETVCEEGTLVRIAPLPGNLQIADALPAARAAADMSQKDLAAATGIDRSDISKIERGLANPSVSTLTRPAEGLGAELKIEFAPKSK